MPRTLSVGILTQHCSSRYLYVQVFFVLSEIRGRLWAVFAWFIIADIALRDTLPDYELNSMAGAVLLCFVAMIAVCIVLHHKAITSKPHVLAHSQVLHPHSPSLVRPYQC